MALLNTVSVKRTVLIQVAIFICVGFAGATIRRVPQNFPTIQSGINAAVNGDTVLVSEGTFFENIRYRGKRITVASLYLLDQDTMHISRTIINGSQPTHPDSGSVVSFLAGEDTNSVLSGFTITGGTGTLDSTGTARAGGGILCFRGGATIRWNNIVNNVVVFSGQYASGGGIYTGVDLTIIENNEIVGNSVQGENVWGGGMFTFGDVRIINNRVENNMLRALNGTTSGGGIGSQTTSTGAAHVLIKNNIIRGNTSQTLSSTSGCYGGGLDIYYPTVELVGNTIASNTTSSISFTHAPGFRVIRTGQGSLINGNIVKHNREIGTAPSVSAGGIAVYYCSPLVTNNIIADNSAVFGSGIYVIGPTTSMSSHNPDKADGGLCIAASRVSTQQNSASAILGIPAITNNTIVDNTGGAGIRVNNANVVVLNSILWGNTGGQISIGTTGSAEVHYSDIQGGWPSGTGNINADPAFEDSLYRIGTFSPCINAAIDSLQIGGVWYRAPRTDFFGSPRPNPAGSRPDIGSHEAPGIAPPSATYTRRPNLAIPDGAPAGVSDTMNLPAIGAGMFQLVIDTLNHTYVGDLKMTLTSPNGDTVAIMNSPGDGPFGSSGDNFIGTVFSDTATRAIESILPADAPHTGYWTPDGQLGTFENKNIPAGTWRLFVSDTYPVDAGTLVRWTIRIIPPTSSTPPSIASTPLSNSGSIVNRVVPVRIFDLDGIATGTGAPRLWHKRSTDGAYTAVVADSIRSGNYSFSIPGRAAGTRVQYYIAAQDVNNNMSTLPRGGSGINPPGSTVPPTVYSYIVQNSLLAGSYNVGAGGNFPTLDSAFNKLNIDGITGAITLNLTDTLYVATPHAMTATQQLLQRARENQKQSIVQPEHGIANADFSPAMPSGITNGFVLEGPISGASATNRITIRPATGKAVRITGNVFNTVLLTNASYVTIDGIGLAGATRLTVECPSTDVGNSAIGLIGDCDNTIIQNITARGLFNASNVIEFDAINENATPDSNIIRNNSVPSGRYGILFVGTATALAKGNRITGNLIGAAADSIGEFGICCQGTAGMSVDNNVVRRLRDAGINPYIVGIYYEWRHLNSKIWNNVVYDMKGSTGNQVWGIFIRSQFAADATDADMYNNMVYDLNSQSSATTSIGGIYVSTGQRDTVAYNSVFLTGNANGLLRTSTAVWAETPASQVFRNNIFVNTRTEASGRRALVFYKESATSTISSNFNDLFVLSQPNSYIGGVGTANYTTIAEWRSIGFDAQSVSVNPAFRAPHLHLDSTVATSLNGGGTLIAGITRDFDGQLRNATRPDIGADEIDTPTGVAENTAPHEFALFQNYPNPFNPSTEIKFSVGENGRATLEVFNILGQKVATLFDGVAQAGQYYKVKLDGTNLASGVYLYKLQSGARSDVKKLLLLK